MNEECNDEQFDHAKKALQFQPIDDDIDETFDKFQQHRRGLQPEQMHRPERMLRLESI